MLLFYPCISFALPWSDVQLKKQLYQLPEHAGPMVVYDKFTPISECDYHEGDPYCNSSPVRGGMNTDSLPPMRLTPTSPL
jgi:hypothetical protein